MNRCGYLANRAVKRVIGIVFLCAATAATHQIWAETVEISTGKDNTLYQYDPTTYDPLENGSWIKSNGEGNYFGAGRTYGKDQIQRGLLQFNIGSAGIAPGSHIDSVSLRLRVVDIPKKDQTPRDFWLVALPEFVPDWGEAGSDADIGVSGGGSGADPEAGDATWFHTQYDPTDPIHNDTTASDSPWQYHADSTGFWPDGSVVSPGGLNLTLGQGALGNDTFIIPGGYAPAGENVGAIGDVNWSTTQMAADVQAWVDDPTSNFGWIVLGDESIVNEPGGDKHSSKRGFASFQEANSAFRPLLTIEYSSGPAVPEPSTCLLTLIGLILATGSVWRRKR